MGISVMARFAANISMLFTEYSFLERFSKAAQAGFNAVEFTFPYEYDAILLKQQLDANNLTQALFNAPPGNWSEGERGLACLADRTVEFITGVELACEYAQVLGNRYIHVMAGVKPDDVGSEAVRSCYVNNIRAAAKIAAKYDISILIEPINNVDMPGYFLNYPAQAIDIIDEVNEGNVGLQFDFYHCQMMQGNVVTTFEKYFNYIKHVQIAGVPGRHEPNVGELNYDYVLDRLDKMAFQGVVGCEYKPLGQTEQGLGWLKSAKSGR
jgi:hydroxypyruvate isomerase